MVVLVLVLVLVLGESVDLEHNHQTGLENGKGDLEITSAVVAAAADVRDCCC